MMNVTIIDHEEALVVMFTGPEVGSVDVTLKKGKDLRQSKGVYGSVEGVCGDGTQFDKLSVQIVITDAFAKVLGDVMGAPKYDRAVLEAYSASVLKTLYIYVGLVLDVCTIATHRLERGAGRVEGADLVLEEPY